VQNIVEFVQGNFPKMKIDFEIRNSDLHEAQILKLDNAQALKYLSWKSRWKASEAIHKTFAWYEKFKAGENALDITLAQIREFQQ
jgi:nucleoside-diphosphate-sugar epimerase